MRHQQHLPPQGLNGGWRSKADIAERRKMTAKIVQLLQPNAPQDWLDKLPQMASRLEETLYRTAPTFAAYNDADTLKQRLRQLAMHMNRPPQQQGLNGGWRSKADIAERRKMIAKIVQLLQSNAPQDWLNKLPQMARRLEETLYRTAPTFAAYNDADTLKQRLQQLAMHMNRPPQQQVQRPQQQQQQQQSHLAQTTSQTAKPTTQQPQQPVQTKQSNRMVNMSDINPQAPKAQQDMNGTIHTATPVTSQKNEQTEEQRRERQRSIQLHMALLLHAATCSSSKCHSQNCAKMKGLLKHGESCPTKAKGGCIVCKRVWNFLRIHARQCKDPKCPVPKCLAIRE